MLSREEAIHRIRLTPLIQAATRLHRRDVLEGIVFPVGKNYEDAFTTPEIIEHATAVACIKEKPVPLPAASGKHHAWKGHLEKSG